MAETTKSAKPAQKKAARAPRKAAAKPAGGKENATKIEQETKKEIRKLTDQLATAKKKIRPGKDRVGKVGLALSGGGYRASLFHLGALWRLNELGWLKKLDDITSVSGGSIVAAYLGMRWSELNFDDDGVATNFDAVFVKPMRKMCATTIDLPTIGKGLLKPVGSARDRVDGKKMIAGAIGIFGEAVESIGGRTGRTVATAFARPFGAVLKAGIDAAAVTWDNLNPFPTPGELLIKTYDRLLFHGKTLQDLPNPNVEGNPRFTFYATNMQTGSSVRMNRNRLLDYKLGQVDKPEIPLAKAVAASSGFPPFYSPVELEIPSEKWSGGKKHELDRAQRTRLRKRVDLADGAVYDNLGTTLLEFNCETILVSDAGDSLDVIDALPGNWLSQATRTILVSMDQTNKLRMKSLINEFSENKRKGVYWGISYPIKVRLEKEGKAPELLVDNEKTRAVGEMRTRLNRFTDEEQENLINWGYALSDARMRRRVIPKGKDTPGTLPFPGRLQ